MTTRNGKLLLPLLAGTLLLGACELSSDGLTGGDEARLSIQLTDAPGDLKEAWVKIDSIYLLGTDSTNNRLGFSPKNTGWIDLLTLAGGKFTDLVTATTVPAGTYTQLRVVVCDAYIKTTDNKIIATSGSTLPAGVTPTPGTQLKLTSICRSGFKVILPAGGVTIGSGTNTLLLDFDVKQSFVHEAGKSGNWIVTPVLHAVKKEGTAAAGSIGGTVALAQGVTIPACGGQATLDLTKFVPTATSGTTIKTGTTAANGAYTIASVVPGNYTMGVDKVGFANGDTLSFTAAANPASVAVASGATATSNYSVTAASCKVKT